MHGESWDGQRSKAANDAPEAGVELGFGEGFPDADLVFECDNADELYAQAKRHGIKIVDEIQDLDWGAHLFTVEMPAHAGKLIFSYNETCNT